MGGDGAGGDVDYREGVSVSSGLEVSAEECGDDWCVVWGDVAGEGNANLVRPLGDIWVVSGVFCGVWRGVIGSELGEGEVAVGGGEEVEGGVIFS